MAEDCSSIVRQSVEAALAPNRSFRGLGRQYEAGSPLTVDLSSDLASAQVEGSVSNGLDMHWPWAIRLCLTFSFLDKQWLWDVCLRPLRTCPALGRSPLPDLDYSNGHALALGRSPLSDLQFSGQAVAKGRLSSSTARVADYGPVTTARPQLFRTNVGFGLFALFCISNGHALALGRPPLSDLHFSGQAVAIGQLSPSTAHVAGYGPVASARPWLFRTNIGHSLRSNFSDQETSGKGRPVSTIAFVEKWSRRTLTQEKLQLLGPENNKPTFGL